MQTVLTPAGKAIKCIYQQITSSNRRSSEIQGTALWKCLRVSRRVCTLCWGYSKTAGSDDQILVKEAEKALEMQVKHCLWGTCSSESRFPSFVKVSVLCRLPNQRERLKHTFVGEKPAGVPTSSPMSAKLDLFLLLEAVGISHTKGASEPVK